MKVKVDCSALNAVFGVEGSDYMWMDESDLEPIAWQGIAVPFWTGKTHTQESRELMSQNMKGIKRSAQARENMSRAQRGKVYDEEYKRNMEVATAKKTYELTYADGSVKIVKGLHRWCKDNGYQYTNLQYVKSGRQKYHKDIVGVKIAHP